MTELRLTAEEQDRIRAEEVYRSEIRERLANDRSGGRGGWKFLNSAFALWFLSTIVIGGMSWIISERHLAIQRENTVRRATWEIYGDGLQFEAAIAVAWTRFDYETAFSTTLQNPRSRLFDQKTFGLDWLTFQIEDTGTPRDAAAAYAARDAAGRIWKVLEDEFGGRDKDWWWVPLDFHHKAALDALIKDQSHTYLVQAFLPRASRRSCWLGG
jgi:hypothetical protein